MLFATYTAVSIIPLLLFSSVIFKTTENYYIEERKKELLNQANIFSGHITISIFMTKTKKASLTKILKTQALRADTEL